MVKIRLARVGRSNQKKYRIVVADEQSAAGGKFLEIIGTLDQTLKPSVLNLNKERYQAWIAKGAQPTVSVYKLAGETS